jgi:hypothetical protein
MGLGLGPLTAKVEHTVSSRRTAGSEQAAARERTPCNPVTLNATVLPTGQAQNLQLCT